MIDSRDTFGLLPLWIKLEVMGRLAVRVCATLFTSDHDGYCSGAECELEERDVEYTVDVPVAYWLQATMEGTVPLEPTSVWAELYPDPIEGGGSGFCALDPACEALGLDRHEHKLTVHSVEVVAMRADAPSDVPAEFADVSWDDDASVLRLVGWATEQGRVDVLKWVKSECVQLDHPHERCRPAVCVAAARGLVDVLEFWKSVLGMTATDVRAGDNEMLFTVANSAYTDRVRTLVWLQGTYSLGAADARAADNRALVHAAIRGHGDVVACLRRTFRLKPRDFKQAIMACFKLATEERKGGDLVGPPSSQRCGEAISLLMDTLVGRHGSMQPF